MSLCRPQILDRQEIRGQECGMEDNKGSEVQSEMRQGETLTPIKKGDREKEERMLGPVKKWDDVDMEITTPEQLAVVANHRCLGGKTDEE